MFLVAHIEAAVAREGPECPERGIVLFTLQGREEFTLLMRLLVCTHSLAHIFRKYSDVLRFLCGTHTHVRAVFFYRKGILQLKLSSQEAGDKAFFEYQNESIH